VEDIIIYVAGNPNLYPIEYFDSGTGTFEGMIPELLRDFSENTNYDIRYYNTGGNDQRQQLSENLQVDMISGCVAADRFRHKSGEEILLFETSKEGKPVTYRLFLSDVAPESLRADLQSFLSEVSQETKTGLLLETVESNAFTQRSWEFFAVAGLLVLSLALTGVIVFLVKKYSRRVKSLENDKETDTLTGIGNTDYLINHLPKYVNDRNRILYSMYYFFVDVDRMNRIGGRTETNEFIQHVASVLEQYTSDNDILARVAAGGFCILRLSPGISDREWFRPALKSIRSYSESNGKPFSSDIAVGIYQLQPDDRDLNEILFYADKSAQTAYREGRDYKSCNEEFLKVLMEERRLQSDAGRGLKYGQFHLYIQFYADAKSGRITGGEALSRWEHPEKGFLSSERFVPLMEREGLISQLDYYLLDKVCAFLAYLHRSHIDNFFVSCHFSAKTISTNDCVMRCKNILDKYQFFRENIILEIEESAIVENLEVVRFNVEKLKKLGVCIALGDIGEGFTSLFDAKGYQLDVLKLDRNLVDDLSKTTGDAVLRAMIQVGHELGIEVLAEGVKNEEQERILKEMNCDMIEDFRFRYPLPSWEVEKKLVQERMESENSGV